MLSYVGRPPTTCMPMLSIMVSYCIPIKFRAYARAIPHTVFWGLGCVFGNL
jgi:hypothetical protein